MLIRAYLTILMIFNAFPFFSFKPTTEQSHSISPHTSIFPAPISKILWAGTNQNKVCSLLSI